VVTLFVGATIVLFTALSADQIEWLESLVVDLVEDLPTWLEGMFLVIWAVGLIYAGVLIGLVAVQGRSRLRLLRDLVFVVVASFVLGVILSLLVSGAWPDPMPDAGETEGQYPVLRVAAVTAVLIVAGPHLVRPFRRLGWLIVILLGLAATGLRLGMPSDVLGGIGVALVAAGGVLVAFGSPRGYPDVSDVETSLGQLGVDATGLTVADRQSWGVRQFDARRTDGTALAVSVYGRDARDAQLITKSWRSLWYRDSGPALSMSRLHQVEHEALVTVFAGRSGVSVQELVAAGEPNEREALLVLGARGRPLAGIGAEDMEDSLLVAVWRSVGDLHDAGIAHGRLNVDAVRVDEGRPVLEGFDAGSVAAPEVRIQADVVELLVSLGDRVGVDRAVSSARRGLGDPAVIAALPYVQRSAVSSETRNGLSHPRALFRDLKDEMSSQTGVEPPKPVPLHRVTWRQLLTFALTLLAAYALIGMLSGIDFAEVWEELQDASWGWVLAAFVVSQLPLLSEAAAMMAAVAQPIPLEPTIQLQSAIKFIQLAIGGAAGRMATNIAYLRKFGVPATDAVTQGGVDSLTGFFVQAVIILVAILFGGVTLIPDDVSIDVPWLMIVVIVGAAIAGSVLMVVFIPALRKRVVPPLQQVWSGLSALGRDPTRLLTLIGANIVTQLFYATGLWLTAQAFGLTLPFTELLLINTIASLFAGLLPIPGGVGVTEALLTAGLVAIGVGESVAFAIAVTFRVVSSYLPPVWGWFSMRWLEHNDYL